MKIAGHQTEPVHRRYAVTNRESAAEGMKEFAEFRQRQAEVQSVVPLRRET
jgi:hypothetical protein